MHRPKEVILYTRAECHLCEFAAQLLDQCAVAWHEFDIESDLGLIRKYGHRIPVLYRPDLDSELSWPFTEDLIKEFIDDEI